MKVVHLEEGAVRSAHEHIDRYLKEIDTLIGDQPNAEPAVGIDHFALGPNRDVLHGRVRNRSIHVAFILEKIIGIAVVVVECRQELTVDETSSLCSRDI